IVQLQFIAISNKTYSIEYIHKLGGSDWQKLIDITAKTNTGLQLLSIPADGDNSFYRLVTPRRSD
ncbi:MAG TPA: hypothetical protein PLW02_10850, partial [Verrucomicrobiota bacterium]|nr:hypothetical protein [Verrucomicrobiota bacterium]